MGLIQKDSFKYLTIGYLNRGNLLVKIEEFLRGNEVPKKLKQLIKSSDRIQIAVAFIKEGGYSQITKELEASLKKGNEIDFVVGASPQFRITDPTVLEKLVDLKKRYKNLTLKVFEESYFHPKLFIFQKNQLINIVLGSSNLTSGGIGSNIEGNIAIKGRSNEEIISKILKFFKNEIIGLSFPLTHKFVEEYKEYCKKIDRITRKASFSRWKKQRKTGSSKKIDWRNYPNPHKQLTKEKEIELKRKISAIPESEWDPRYCIDFAVEYETNSHAIRGYKAHIHNPKSWKNRA